MDEKTLETLKNIGLTQGESKVYLALTMIGTSSVSDIIKTSEISASKVYFVLEKLIEKGLVTLSIQNKVKIFSPTAPERIIDYLNEKERLIQKHKQEANEIVQKLRAKREFITKSPPIEFSKGSRAYDTIFNEVYSNLKEGEEYLGLGGHRISFKLQNLWFKQSSLLSEKKVSQLLAYEKEVWYKKDPKVHQRKKRKRYYPRVLGPEYKDLPSIIILGDKSIISDVDEDGEVFSLLIRNKNLCLSMKKLMKAVYLSGKVPEGYKPYNGKIEL